MVEQNKAMFLHELRKTVWSNFLEAIPYMPIEIINFPRWFPFNIYKISYWSRTVLIPLLIIMDKKPLANNPNGTDIQELFKNLGDLLKKLNLQIIKILCFF